MSKLPQTSREWENQVFREYVEYQNPKVTSDIDVVWAISGRGSYSAQLTSYLLSSPEFASNDIYREDDRGQTDFAVSLVCQITALRLNKKINEVSKEDIEKYGPVFVYNGLDAQNEDLRNAVEAENFILPKTKVIIERLSLDDNPKDANTLTQFEKFPQELLKDLIKNNRKIALVQARWHLARIARTINSNATLSAQPLWNDVEIVYFVSDSAGRELPEDSKGAIDIKNVVKSEAKRIMEYSKKGNINVNPRYS